MSKSLIFLDVILIYLFINFAVFLNIIIIIVTRSQKIVFNKAAYVSLIYWFNELNFRTIVWTDFIVGASDVYKRFLWTLIVNFDLYSVCIVYKWIKLRFLKVSKKQILTICICPTCLVPVSQSWTTDEHVILRSRSRSVWAVYGSYF